MPYVVSDGPCKKCGSTNTEFRLRFNKTTNKGYLQTTCKVCERAETKRHQQENRDYWREKCRKYHLKKVGTLRNVRNRTPEDRANRAREKSLRRKSYVKQASFTDELTEFIAKEAKDLRAKRIAATGVNWEIDHTVPFKGKTVSGLHIWSNIRVITSSENAKKGNCYVSVHD